MPAPKRTYSFKAKIWLFQGNGAWHFLTVPKKESDQIQTAFGAHARGWRSLKITATIGTTTWQTSIFPDSKAGAYLLPLKASVRKAEALLRDDIVSCKLRIL